MKRLALALSLFGTLSLSSASFADELPNEEHHAATGDNAEKAAHGEHTTTEHAAGAHMEEHAATAAHDEHGEHGEHSEHGGEHAGPHGGAHGGHHGVQPFNFADFGNKETPPYLAMLINFALLVGLYVWLGKKPIADGLKQRRIDIAKNIDDADALLKASEERLAGYSARFENVNHDAKKATQTLEESGRGERDRIIREAEERATRMQKDATFLVEQEGKHVRQQLVEETAELAVSRALDILSKSVTKEDHQRLADEFLANLSKRPTTSARAS